MLRFADPRFHAAAEVIMVVHMPTRISLLWTVVLLTLPCPLFPLYWRAARRRAGPERQPDRGGGLTGTGGRGAHDRRGRDYSRRWALGGLVPGAPTPAPGPRHRHRGARRRVAV